MLGPFRVLERVVEDELRRGLLRCCFVVWAIAWALRALVPAHASAAAPGVAEAGAAVLRIDADSGLPEWVSGGVRGMQDSWVFWGADWRRAAAEVRGKPTGDGRYRADGSVADLGLELGAKARLDGERRIEWSVDLASPRRRDGVVGGVAFRFDLERFGAAMGAPQLLPDRRGFAWGRAGVSRIELRFSDPVADVRLERGGEIRVLFFKGAVDAGAQRAEAMLVASGGTRTGPSLAERFGGGPSDWVTQRMPTRVAPIDLSFMNESEKPAGRRGFVQAVGERLAFQDGMPARFWGANLAAYAIFSTPREQVRAAAQRLSAMGFNLVRLHHHDSAWVEPNVFGRGKRADTASLDEAAMERYDWWIKCLKDEGIYVWVDLHVGRAFRVGDGIDAFDEIANAEGNASAAGVAYVNAGMQEAMKRFNAQIVGRVNRHTGVRYADEPAIMAFALTNENDLTSHYGNALLPDKKVPAHTAVYMREARAFADRWGQPRDRVWRSWEPGPSKLFLNDLEHRFNESLAAPLRRMGVRVPLSTTSTWGDNPTHSLPALAGSGADARVVDAHAYGRAGDVGVDPFLAPIMTHWLAAAQVADRPTTVTEWNVEPFPAQDRHLAPLMVGAMAAHQGWDAVMVYAWSQSPLEGATGPGNYEAASDPSLLATLPAAALLYRQGHVSEATTTYAFTPSAETLYSRAVSPANSVALRTASERGRLVTVLPATRELPWLAPGGIPSGAIVFSDPQRPLVESGEGPIVSDTGELARDWREGVYRVDTPRTQAAGGWIGGRTIRLRDVELQLGTANATVAVQSLDGQPIGKSRSIVVSLGTRSQPRNEGRIPFAVEPVVGTIRIRAPAGLESSFRSFADGAVVNMPTLRQDGWYELKLDRARAASRWQLGASSVGPRIQRSSSALTGD